MPKHNWIWNVRTLENVAKPNVKTTYADGSWRVTALEKDLAWGYCLTLPDEAKAHIMWHARVEVRQITGDIWPGLAFHDSSRGMLFLVNAVAGKAELRLLNVSREAVRTDLFKISEVEYPFALALEYNALTAKCIGRIGEDKIFDFKLPHKKIPAMAVVTSLEIVTTTPPGKSGGVVEYGSLVLNCE
jgi:hypothetical protein